MKSNELINFLMQNPDVEVKTIDDNENPFDGEGAEFTAGFYVEDQKTGVGIIYLRSDR